MLKEEYSEFTEIFGFRTDVYARGRTLKNGKIGFTPACKNEGGQEICQKPCHSCPNPRFRPFAEEVLGRHFRGKDLIGVYPLLPNNMTKEVVCEFSARYIKGPHDSIPFEYARSYAKAAKKLGLNAYIQRRESENVYAVWIFFKKPIPYWKARQTAELIIPKSGISLCKEFKYRIIPEPDIHMGDNFGGSIVLPFPGERLKKQGGVFLQSHKGGWRPYKNKVAFLKRLKQSSENLIDKILQDNDREEDQKMIELKPKLRLVDGNQTIFDIQDGFFDGRSFQSKLLTNYLLRKNDFFHDGSGFYSYRSDSGLWVRVEADTIGREIMNLLGDRAKSSYIKECLALLKIQVSLPNIESQPFLINMQNGMFDLEKLKLLPHDKNCFSTFQLPIKYDPKAQCPRWKKFLKEVIPGASKVRRTLQQFAGYCLYPKITIHKCLFLVGSGGNGKSIFINTILKLIGERNYVSIEPNQFVDKFLIGSLKDKLLNVSTEIQGISKKAINIWKKVIAGDLIQADRKFDQPYQFFPIAKHIFSLNEIPALGERTWAIERRIIVVGFNVVFDSDKSNEEIEAQLALELPGIFNWALRGYKRLRETGRIYESKNSKVMKKNFLRGSSPVLRFVEKKCEVGSGLSIAKDKLYQAYAKYCEEFSDRGIGRNKFYKELLDIYPSVLPFRPKGSVWYFRGIGLKSKSE